MRPSFQCPYTSIRVPLLKQEIHAFHLAREFSKITRVKKIAELNEDQVQFLKDTAKLVQQKREMMLKVREERNFGNDYYFISQLYDADWCPTPIAEAL